MTHDLCVGQGAVLVFTDEAAASRVAAAIEAEREHLFQLDGVPVSVRGSNRDEPAEPEGEPAAEHAVRFASAPAAKLADDEDLTEADFEGVEPSSPNGYTKGDVESILEG